MIKSAPAVGRQKGRDYGTEFVIEQVKIISDFNKLQFFSIQKQFSYVFKLNLGMFTFCTGIPVSL